MNATSPGSHRRRVPEPLGGRVRPTVVPDPSTAGRPPCDHESRTVAQSQPTAVVLALALMVAGCGSVGAVGASQERDATTPEEQAVPTDLPTSPTPGGAGVRCSCRKHGRDPHADRTVPCLCSRRGAAGGRDGHPRCQCGGAGCGDTAGGGLPRPRRSHRHAAAGPGRERPPGGPRRRSSGEPSATVGLVPCSGEGALAPGSYDVYARVVLNLEDGSRTDSLGGPWPLELR